MFSSPENYFATHGRNIVSTQQASAGSGESDHHALSSVRRTNRGLPTIGGRCGGTTLTSKAPAAFHKHGAHGIRWPCGLDRRSSLSCLPGHLPVCSQFLIERLPTFLGEEDSAAFHFGAPSGAGDVLGK